MNKKEVEAAMDAAIKKAQKETKAATIAQMNGIAEAKELVAPIVGTIAVACDSAESVYAESKLSQSLQSDNDYFIYTCPGWNDHIENL